MSCINIIFLKHLCKNDQLDQDELVLDYEEDDLSPLEARRHKLPIRDGDDSQLPMPRRWVRRRKQQHKRCSAVDTTFEQLDTDF